MVTKICYLLQVIKYSLRKTVNKRDLETVESTRVMIASLLSKLPDETLFNYEES